MGKHSKVEDSAWKKIVEVAQDHLHNRCQCTSAFKAADFNDRYPRPEVIYPEIHNLLVIVARMDYPNWELREGIRKRYFPNLPPETPPRSKVSHLEARTRMRETP